MEYSIHEVAQKLNITKHTIYYYEKEGLLPNIKRDSKRNRVFTQSDVSWIYLIRCLSDIHMPISNIRRYIELLKNKNKTLNDRQEVLLQFKKTIHASILKYQRVEQLIDKKLDYYLLQEMKDESSCYDYHSDWEYFKKILDGERNE